MSDWPTWAILTGQLFFPIAVAAFVLVRVNGKLGKLTEAVQELTQSMALLLEHLRGGTR